MADTSLADALNAIRANGPKFYVYVMKLPDGAPFYVGKGQRRRVAVHEEHAKSKKRSRKLSIIRGVWKSGLSVKYEIIGFYANESEAFAVEADLIAKFGRRDLGSGILANVTDGGEGVSGYIHTDESRIKMAKGILASAFSPEARSVAMKKLSAIPEFIEKRRASEGVRAAKVAAYQKSEENRRIKSEQMRRILAADSDLRERRALQLRAVAPSSDAVAIATKAAWADPEMRNRRVASLKEAANQPELIEKRRQQALLRWSDPEARKRQSEACKAAYLRKKKEKNSRGVGA